MRMIPGGMAKLGEDWVEKYHQDGFHYDFCFSRVKDLEKQASAQCEQVARRPQVFMMKELMLEDSREKGRRRGLVNKGIQNQIQIKEERRHELLLKA